MRKRDLRWDGASGSALDVPRIPGVYAIWRGRKCLYVGMSRSSIRGRCLTHMEQLAHLAPDRVTWVSCRRPARDECLYIYVLDPPCNSTAKE